MFCFARLSRTRLAAMVAPALVTVTRPQAVDPNAPTPAHHQKGGGYVNPWESFKAVPVTPSSLLNAYKDWTSKPVPPPEELPQVVTPDWGLAASATAQDKEAWKADVKGTWLGHACFLVEFPTLPGTEGRGARVLFDPVFSQRCSPSQWVGPKRVTNPPFKLEELPHVDCVVISHNHYDHTDVTTLKHIYKSQEKGSVHFFVPLGNAKWFASIGVAPEHVSEMDWWEERDLSVQLPTGPAHLRVSALPSQHFTGRSVHDRFDTLWASWAVRQLPSPTSQIGGSVWFGGDTGYKTVPRGATTEVGLPVCPAFKEIGNKVGPFDLSMIPIGAYDPRWAFSMFHVNPEDAVEIHMEVKSRKSVGMHYGTWILTCEEMTEPPKRLRSAGEARGISDEEFGVCDIGATVRSTPVDVGREGPKL